MPPSASSNTSLHLSPTVRAGENPATGREVVFGVRDLSVAYGSSLALAGVNLEIYKNVITALIGPSGCGKSTFIRCLNRMNDLVPGIKVGGQTLYHGVDLYGA